MSTPATSSYAVRDSMTMLRRNLKYQLRYPSVTVLLIAQPLLFLLLFVYVFGGTMGDGLPEGGGRTEYLSFITPGVLMIAVASAVAGTALAVAMDMTKGIIARFRTMAIARVSVLTGHVLGSMVLVITGVTVVLGVAMLLGFRATTDPLDLLGVVGLLLLLGLAMTWLGVAMGLASPNVEAAGNMPIPLMLLPFLSSGFTPTDSMPAGLRHFAEHQPFTPIINTLRGLLDGTVEAGDASLAVAWCLALGAVGYLWSRRLYRRTPIR